jgi:S-DNA-T family DNA segregation ATPase FtsK/SpoIIIE
MYVGLDTHAYRHTGLEAVASVLATAGPHGMSARQITATVEKLRGSAHKGSIHRALRSLVDSATIRQTGDRRGYRYQPTTHRADNAA